MPLPSFFKYKFSKLYWVSGAKVLSTNNILTLCGHHVIAIEFIHENSRTWIIVYSKERKKFLNTVARTECKIHSKLTPKKEKKKISQAKYFPGGPPGYAILSE